MSLQGMDVNTAERLAGLVQMLRRAAALVWAAAVAEGVGSPRQVLGSRDPRRRRLPKHVASLARHPANPFSQAWSHG